uniref:Uncharacterized protein n=1 Tax=Anguilla anguilla TaxID=7936 RepID=A0A0E9QE13_ANGAN
MTIIVFSSCEINIPFGPCLIYDSVMYHNMIVIEILYC